MLVSKVAQKDPLDRFIYWIKERHKVYLKRSKGKPKPWTDDAILQNYFFTNPYRENDKTTIWFKDNVREKMRHSPNVIFATACFRWFNRISTGQYLKKIKAFTHWNEPIVVKALTLLQQTGTPVFTGAYIIMSTPHQPKINAICRSVSEVWQDRHNLIKGSKNWTTLKKSHKQLNTYYGLGKFMAYEIVCDLRYTDILNKATDVNTWCNPGPGCRRGILRLIGSYSSENRTRKIPVDWLNQLTDLLAVVNKRLPRTMPKFELREIEHSLCEWDKYERALHNDGQLKRRYKGTL